MCQFNRKSAYLLSAMLLVASLATRAHDFWIEPQTFRAAVGTTIPLRLYVGEHFKGDSLIYLPGRIERYTVIGPSGEHPVEATPGDDPAGGFRPTQPGLHVVAYRSRLDFVRFDSVEEFERYLDKEGLERVRNLGDYRERVGHRPIREQYSRCAKSLVAVGAATGADRALGLRLELIAERNPYARDTARLMPVRLLYEGRPLGGALIVAFNNAEPQKKIKVRSAVDGRAGLHLSGPGTWLVTAVHLLPAPPGAPAEWESLWASLSFELPAR